MSICTGFLGPKKHKTTGISGPNVLSGHPGITCFIFCPDSKYLVGFAFGRCPDMPGSVGHIADFTGV